jgi:hypothetical protein
MSNHDQSLINHSIGADPCDGYGGQDYIYMFSFEHWQNGHGHGPEKLPWND